MVMSQTEFDKKYRAEFVREFGNGTSGLQIEIGHKQWVTLDWEPEPGHDTTPELKEIFYVRSRVHTPFEDGVRASKPVTKVYNSRAAVLGVFKQYLEDALREAPQHDSVPFLIALTKGLVRSVTPEGGTPPSFATDGYAKNPLQAVWDLAHYGGLTPAEMDPMMTREHERLENAASAMRGVTRPVNPPEHAGPAKPAAHAC